MSLFLLGGYTGSGKTEILEALESKEQQVINLEAIANHNGSSFGSLPEYEQITPYQFHKRVKAQWSLFDQTKPIFCESKSPYLGKLKIPDWLFTTFQTSPVIWLDIGREFRLKRLIKTYGHMDHFSFIHSLIKISKKISGKEFEEIFEHFNLGRIDLAFDKLMDYYDHGVYYKKQEHLIIAEFKFSDWKPDDMCNKILQLVNSFRE